MININKSIQENKNLLFYDNEYIATTNNNLYKYILPMSKVFNKDVNVYSLNEDYTLNKDYKVFNLTSPEVVFNGPIELFDCNELSYIDETSLISWDGNLVGKEIQIVSYRFQKYYIGLEFLDEYQKTIELIDISDKPNFNTIVPTHSKYIRLIIGGKGNVSNIYSLDILD